MGTKDNPAPNDCYESADGDEPSGGGRVSRQGDAGGDGRPGVPGLDDRMEGGGVTEYSREASRRMTDA